VPSIEVVDVPRKTGTRSPFRIWLMCDSFDADLEAKSANVFESEKRHAW
jgi:hypothetical protein